MSIFRRDPQESPTSNRPMARPVQREGALSERKTSVTYIAAGSKFHGDVTGSAEVLIDGTLEGRLEVESTVTIGREGLFQGEVVAQAVRVEGKLKGNVQGRDLVEVTASGSLEGDIAASRVVIAEGAFFKGNVEMSGGQREARKASPSAQDPPAMGKKDNA